MKRRLSSPPLLAGVLFGPIVTACAGGDHRRAGPQGHRPRRRLPQATAAQRRLLARHGRPAGGGVHRLCTLALLNAGVEPRRSDDDPEGARTTSASSSPRRPTSSSLQTMVFCRAEPERDRC